MMLDDMDLPEYASCLRDALTKTYADGNPDVLTEDIDGCRGSTTGFTQGVIDNLDPEHLKAVPVSQEVNNPRHDRPDLIRET